MGDVIALNQKSKTMDNKISKYQENSIYAKAFQDVLDTLLSGQGANCIDLPFKKNERIRLYKDGDTYKVWVERITPTGWINLTAQA